VRDTAAELLALYAKKRASRHGHAFGIQQPPRRGLCPASASRKRRPGHRHRAVVADMASGQADGPPGLRRRRLGRPRWRCGPVHRGGRRQAGRGALPTTLLAEQHFHTFTTLRRVAGAHRRAVALQDRKQSNEILTKLAAGELTSSSHPQAPGREVKLPRVGLVIIDEEHRFGDAGRRRR